MKNKIKYFICITFLLILIGLAFFIKLNNTNDLPNNSYISDKTADSTFNEATYTSYENFEKIKGVVDFVTDSNIIDISNSYMQENYGFNLDGYSSCKVYFSQNSTILNYVDSSEMKYEDIKNGDILFYEGVVKHSVSENSPKIIDNNIIYDDNTINVDNNTVLILKKEDLEKIVLDEYGNQNTLTNVHIVGQTEFIEELKVKYIFAEIKIKTKQDDELIYCFRMQTTEDTIINNPINSKYADIILKDNFEKSIASPNYGYVREIKQLTYK